MAETNHITTLGQLTQASSALSERTISMRILHPLKVSWDRAVFFLLDLQTKLFFSQLVSFSSPFRASSTLEESTPTQATDER